MAKPTCPDYLDFGDPENLAQFRAYCALPEVKRAHAERLRKELAELGEPVATAATARVAVMSQDELRSCSLTP